MSRIDEQIKILQIKKKKVEFLEHILASAKEYDHKDFSDVKEDVVTLLSQFVKSTVESIENDRPAVQQQNVQTNAGVFSDSPKQPQASAAPKEAGLSVHEIANFALEHRHLAGKQVTVANDKNMVIKGKVVGLDAPNVLVQTDTGPVIKVPVNQVSLA